MREKVGWFIAAMASAVAIFEAWNWYEYGWETPHQHDQDMIATQDAVKEFQMRWICDEDQEELEDLLSLPTRNALQVNRVQQLADKLDENDCHVFE